MFLSRLFLLVAIITIATNSFSQINKVTIQASGLTCSMCSNAINKSIKKLSYVNEVVPNIKNSTFEIYFKPDAVVDFDQLKKKVEDAGFFVANFEVNITFEQLDISNDKHYSLNGTMLHFMNVGNKTLKGEINLRLLDKGYVTSKEFKKNSKYTKMNCYQTGLMESCCNDKTKSIGTRIYHVTI